MCDICVYLDICTHLLVVGNWVEMRCLCGVTCVLRLYYLPHVRGVCICVACSSNSCEGEECLGVS